MGLFVIIMPPVASAQGRPEGRSFSLFAGCQSIHPVTNFAVISPGSSQKPAQSLILRNQSDGQTPRGICRFNESSLQAAVAGSSFVNRSKGFRLFEAAQDDTPSVVRAIEWRNFELLICEAFRREGYRVEERGGSGPDGGIDLIATMSKKRILIQCKDWKTQQVGVMVIRELNDVVTARRADGGVVVTGGTFTKEARDLAETCRIRLIDGNELQKMIGSAQSNPSVSPSPTVQLAVPVNAPPAPNCPKCGTAMVDRIAKQRKLAGKHFWGCSQHPKCTGIRPVS